MDADICHSCIMWRLQQENIEPIAAPPSPAASACAGQSSRDGPKLNRRWSSPEPPQEVPREMIIAARRRCFVDSNTSIVKALYRAAESFAEFTPASVSEKSLAFPPTCTRPPALSASDVRSSVIVHSKTPVTAAVVRSLVIPPFVQALTRPEAALPIAPEARVVRDASEARERQASPVHTSGVPAGVNSRVPLSFGRTTMAAAAAAQPSVSPPAANEAPIMAPACPVSTRSGTRTLPFSASPRSEVGLTAPERSAVCAARETLTGSAKNSAARPEPSAQDWQQWVWARMSERTLPASALPAVIPEEEDGSNSTRTTAASSTQPVPRGTVSAPGRAQATDSVSRPNQRRTWKHVFPPSRRVLSDHESTRLAVRQARDAGERAAADFFIGACAERRRRARATGGRNSSLHTPSGAVGPIDGRSGSPIRRVVAWNGRAGQMAPNASAGADTLAGPGRSTSRPAEREHATTLAQTREAAFMYGYAEGEAKFASEQRMRDARKFGEGVLHGFRIAQGFCAVGMLLAFGAGLGLGAVLWKRR